MRRPANAVRLACGHPMCDPGSAECRTRDALGTTPEQAEQLRATALAALDRGPLPGEHRPTTTVPMPAPETSYILDVELVAAAAGIRTRVDPDWTGGAELHRSDCATNSYDNGPCDCGASGITAEVLAQLVADARAERDQHLDVVAYRAWRRARPGFARLLDLTDRT